MPNLAFNYFIESSEDSEKTGEENNYELNMDPHPFDLPYNANKWEGFGKFTSHQKEKDFYLNLGNFAEEIHVLLFDTRPNYMRLMKILQICK